MAAAVTRASYFGANATEPAGVTAETGTKFSLNDTNTSGTTPIPIPTATGTDYSWHKMLALEVTTVGTTSISNRRVAFAAAATTGLSLNWKNLATYTQATSGNKVADNVGTNAAVPSTYAAVTTSNQLWDNTSTVTTSLGRNGNFVQLITGVDFTYAGGAGSAIALPNILLVYDEA